ncbi:unnamed protein product [Amoebophrya sp. A25]|nr:unnamed protein product [Amoebophrya sp. A25]|eukprot:GSA25T00010886001.1
MGKRSRSSSSESSASCSSSSSSSFAISSDSEDVRSLKKKHSKKDQKHGRTGDRDIASSKKKKSKSSKADKKKSKKDENKKHLRSKKSGKKKKKEDKKTKKKDDKKKKRKKDRRDADEEDDDDDNQVEIARYGKYGILNEENFDTKQDEFHAWIWEVKKQSLEHLSKREEKQLELAFMEDYNTCTMPDKKFYDINAWEKQRAREQMAAAFTGPQVASLVNPSNSSSNLTARSALAGGNGLKEAGDGFDDEGALLRERQRKRELEEKKKLDKKVEEMRNYNRDQASDMRHQERLVEQMKLLQKAGNFKEASKIRDRLTPKGFGV